MKEKKERAQKAISVDPKIIQVEQSKPEEVTLGQLDAMTLGDMDNKQIGGSDLYNLVTSSGIAIQSTIDFIDGKLQAIENVEATVLDPQVITQISNLKQEIEGVRLEALSQLKESKDTLDTVANFMRDNATFLTNAIAVNGKMQSFESSISSLLQRVEKLEADKTIKWNQWATIISIIIAFCGICVALGGVVAAFLNQ